MNHSYSMILCTPGGAGVFVCLWLGGGGAAVTAAARAAAAAVLVGGGLFAEDARPREGPRPANSRSSAAASQL